MARLPIPGSDDGTWGDILNDFLSTQHNADGTHSLSLNSLTDVNTAGATNGQVLKFNGTSWVAGTDVSGGAGDPAVGGDLTGTASNAQIAAGAIVNADISATAAIDQSKIANLTADLASKASSAHTHPISEVTNLQASLDAKVDDSEKGAANGVATLDGTGKVPSSQLPAATSPADATTTSKGIVQLAGDLAGTAAAPTVPGLAAKINTSEKGQPNGVAGLDGSGKIVPGQLQAANITKLVPYSYTGTVAVTIGTFRLYNDMGATWTIAGVRASVGTAPAGASIIIDVNKNGTTIFTTQANRPTIAAASNTSGNVTNMDITTVTAGEYLTIDIDQIGSTTAGADLTVQIEVV